MNENVEVLRRLQDVEIILWEVELQGGRLHHPKQLARKRQEYEKLLAQLPETWRNRYLRLLEIWKAELAKNTEQEPKAEGGKRKKLRDQDRLPLVHELNGVCQFCKMTISPALMARMHGDDLEPICPNCGHFLSLEVKK